MAQATTITSTEQALSDGAPAMVVLDVQLPDGSGAALAARLGALAPSAHVVLHSGERPAAPPPGVHAVVPKGSTGALLDHLAALGR